MSQPQMSPEKEQELASKILHRAELAQMTRQLKLGLSNVPSTKRKQDSTTKKRSGEDAEDVDEDHKTLLEAISPAKKPLHDDTNKMTVISPVKFVEKPNTPPSSRQRKAEDRSQQIKPRKEDTPSTPRASATPIILPHASSHYQRPHDKNFMTPKRNNNNSSNHSNNNNNIKKKAAGSKDAPQDSDNTAGADLLMYLATSPYNKSSHHGTPMAVRMPTTPRSYHYASQLSLNGNTAGTSNDAVRFSHIKPSASSPQSTFKSNLLPNFPDESLMDSPSLYLSNNNGSVQATLSPQQRRKPTTNTLHPPSNVPTTPSRELNGTNFNLLRTPNFNMGDYLHNLFSPSPRVPAQQGASNTSASIPSVPAMVPGSSSNTSAIATAAISSHTTNNFLDMNANGIPLIVGPGTDRIGEGESIDDKLTD
ncbi:BFH_HP2_G0043390.mRNA.1.CDS.1 [Saccharomyces cerevisiae]|nr:BFH_HP2_G0043390.mRNA.1.CDS.1 [Saccharomyces cerevisiae]CAI6717749.1 BFH_HP2_G0043390.mRNA.1.CDS.1 [Saccharomyces cerevisiae]CAI6730953.1 BFH_HP1_G0043800.mRNA.1.CDS.1 [Saccharomyces cerevisiae]